MELNIYQVDAFAGQPFTGNPAAVCPLETWLDDALMQAIAAENNLSETAFFVPQGTDYAIRWFTPVTEVDLCGHATLASAWVVFNRLACVSDQVVFHSRSGPLVVTRNTHGLVLDLPVDIPRPLSDQAYPQTNLPVTEALQGSDYLLVVEDSQAVTGYQPDLTMLATLPGRGVIITAADDQYDFVCRFFAPRCGIDEDPVTGSAFTQLVPYWAEKLGKTTLHARQVSARGGDVTASLKGDRVELQGLATLYLEGTVYIPDVEKEI